MYALPTIGKFVLIVAVCLVLVHLFNVLRNRYLRKREAAQIIAIRQAEAKKAAIKRAAREKTIADSVAELQAATERAAAEQAATERAAAEQVATERAAAERAIAEWVAAQETESRQTAEQQAVAERVETERTEAKRIAAEQAIAEWVAVLQREMEQTEVSWSPDEGSPAKKDYRKKDYRKIDAIKEQVFVMLHAMEKEMEDLDYIINKIDMEVEFLPLEIQDILEKWKKGEVYRHAMLEDLKLKFRYKAYSIEDGWEIFHRYTDWIEKQRKKLQVFLRLLGTEAKKSETIPETIERAKQREWGRYLEMDMSVIFTLKEIRDIFQLTVNMESRLQALEKVCKKRSRQIISPPWDP